MGSTTSNSVIQAMKSIFSRHGIPETVRSDNGPQYSSSEFSKFASSYGFSHVTSSPLYPQSNGQVERTVETAQTIRRSLSRTDELSCYTSDMVWVQPYGAVDGEADQNDCPTDKYTVHSEVGLPR